MKRKVEHFINTTVHDLEDEEAISLFPFKHTDAIVLRASTPGIIIEPALFPTLRAGQDGRFYEFCKYTIFLMPLSIIELNDIVQICSVSAKT